MGKVSKSGACTIFMSENRVGVKEYFLNFERIIYKVRGSCRFSFHKRGFSGFLEAI